MVSLFDGIDVIYSLNCRFRFGTDSDFPSDDIE